MEFFGYMAWPFATMGFIFGMSAYFQCAKLKQRLDAIEAERGKPLE